jgi:hypothetical protein
MAPVKHDPMLLPVRRVVERVDVEGEVPGRLLEGSNEQIDEDVAQPPQAGDRDGVPEPREGRLTGEVRAVGGPIGDELEERARSEVS